MKFSRASVALLVIQLVIVSSVAAKYLYQRATCPRVWTRAAAFDPQLIMRGRYLSLQLTVDGCHSTLPSAKQARFPRNVEGVPQGFTYSIDAPSVRGVPARLAVMNNRLAAVRIPDSGDSGSGQSVLASPGAVVRCDAPLASGQLLYPRTRHRPDSPQARPGTLDRSHSPTQRPAPPYSIGSERQRRLEAPGISIGIVHSLGSTVLVQLHQSLRQRHLHPLRLHIHRPQIILRKRNQNLAR